ncbi:MAG TPA: c-type cytochrome domain-containing protein [Chthonomonadales bacterium]|nr:c-type cytochrome domain-containing protein [Chthonomonadales bacterium]
MGLIGSAMLPRCASLLIALASTPPPAAKHVSYHRDIWPIIQSRCQMCHQPASAGGKLVLTTYALFRKGGEFGPVFVPGDPAKSTLLQYLDGEKTLMPKGGPPLPPAQIALFKTWIQQGAPDDTPAARDPIDAAHPPVYTHPPLTTALAYSPDGNTLAISGYREVLLYRSDGSKLIARLVGKSHVIESISYSPDGSILAAAGGAPARFGEIEFWNTHSYKLITATRITYDTVFGGSFSPDGKEFAVGGADNSVRVVSVPDGKQVLKFDNHSDWVFATTFSMDSKNLISASRDEAIKLTLVSSGSFIDDINTHTSPLDCLVRNPKADQVICGGADGIPRLYKIFRTEARTMNMEDHNLLRAFDRQPGPITALAFSPDGSAIAVGSESSVVSIYSVADGKLIVELKGHKGTIHALAYRPDGREIATGGFDGIVRIYSLPAGSLVRQFVPAPITHHRAGNMAARNKAKPRG